MTPTNNGRVAYCCKALRCNFEVVDDERIGVFGDVRFDFDVEDLEDDEWCLNLSSPTGSATKTCKAPQHAIAAIKKYAADLKYRATLESGRTHPPQLYGGE